LLFDDEAIVASFSSDSVVAAPAVDAWLILKLVFDEEIKDLPGKMEVIPVVTERSELQPPPLCWTNSREEKDEDIDVVVNGRRMDE
jgi:hypothetical protein